MLFLVVYIDKLFDPVCPISKSLCKCPKSFMRLGTPSSVTGTVPSQCDSINTYSGCLELKCRLNTIQNKTCTRWVSSKCHFV